MRYVTEFHELETLRLQAAKPVDITLLSIRHGKVYVEINGAESPLHVRPHRIIQSPSDNEVGIVA